jgi:hypothetical protein
MGVSIAGFLQEFRNPRFSNNDLLIPDMMFMPGITQWYQSKSQKPDHPTR